MNPTEIAGILIIQEKRLYLLQREDEDWWEVPGGKVKEDESPTEAAVREAKEEIGVEPELKKPFYTGEFQKDGEMFLWHGYIAEISEEPEIQDDKFKDSKWFTAEDVDEKNTAPNIEMIEPALRKLLGSNN